MNAQPQQTQIRIEAILAAILFNINKTETIKIKPDDASPEVEVLTQCVGIEQEDDALVCVLPLEKVSKFACIPYKCQIRIDSGHVLVSFEKIEKTSGLVTATGRPVNVESAAIQNLIRKLQLGSEVKIEE